ncbi:prepilin-type N-terminal cleavage/methylation domain-containing protein [Lacisediminihabitans changchengi]|uniref:Prepilin-type N-terminal cleavage/methylation domain-containing protein n=1 Tax=Lacisediminihabitans changchengi TaxID=2787634 RepID=A0A934SMT4_9MICO|nr:prepilin-type N-terminal cleavage/methylation domain-containing protein [Lacisediminihabitans changchengi]MBK4348418.1 prepilin-type N-terminal cleavage/methylation domain-containing protein [Lacisediminihabitans changchengi]
MDERRKRADARRDDAGFTLIELLVSMAVFTVFIAILLTTIVALSRSATRTQLVGESTNSTLVVFGNMDRQVRYADSINYPGAGTSGTRYVEFRIPAPSSASGATTCIQWRFDVINQELDSRQWSDGSPTNATAWSTKLENVINDGVATHPFQLIPANISDSPRQQLVLTIDAGNSALDSGASASTTFFARNSSIKSTSNDPLTPVCTFSGYRP